MISSKSLVNVQKGLPPKKFEGGLIGYFRYQFLRKLKKNDVVTVPHGVPVFCTMILLFVSAFF